MQQLKTVIHWGIHHPLNQQVREMHSLSVSQAMEFGIYLMFDQKLSRSLLLTITHCYKGTLFDLCLQVKTMLSQVTVYRWDNKTEFVKLCIVEWFDYGGKEEVFKSILYFL